MSRTRTRRRVPGRLAVLTATTLLGLGSLLLGPSTAHAATAATIDGGRTHQPIDGFGFSEAFGRAAIMHGSAGLPAQRQQEVLGLLFSGSTGAGMSILRLHIGSTPGASIQPDNPGGPNATPRYVWDGKDTEQVWLAKQAKAYGVNRFYAKAWSAPGYLKTTGDEANGGTLCGLSGASCAGGDWRRAYAGYLVQHAKFYAQEGIRINDLGFTNEPDYTTGDVNGYVYWYGASTGATRGLIQLDGDNYRVSKRLWALANYSRFIRPNATRIGAGTATPYLTNNANSTKAQSAIRVTGGAFTATVPGRSLVTYRITGQHP
ncbi:MULTISPECIES: hypothetical protein [unclassified Crossiella]|uniref:hypothetical protein n=1 Tax=unclassified Crossiella TaxID=2620835 RepID=UPI001FFFD733|nr:MULTISPECIES: hypothetical protein [unclassified Crossiella]MCK2244964.1 hypothetical protein [Crossiella sp. S99.2]MCK2258689.1 hypothetical protein [Crossiella sp. S99.1]